MESFKYPPLPQGSDITRMVLLLPHEKENAEIECKLFNYTLSQNGGRKHLYEALSYVWESDVKPKSIKLDGCMFPVTSNLHAALLNLRDGQLTRVLWIDAISINQHNDKEKSSQIPLMQTIYAQAAHVIVWLGEATEDGDKALEKIRSLGAGPDMTSQKADYACLRLLERMWFRRIWVRKARSFRLLINITNESE